LAVDRTAAFTAPAPRLASVPSGVLIRAGYSLAAPLTPPYCGAEQAAARRGWLPGGTAGCPIGREAAERAMASTAVEAVLARVSSSRPGTVGQDRLTWLIVSRPTLHTMALCVGGAVAQLCPPGTMAVTAGQAVVLMDAHSGRVLDVLPVSGAPTPPGRLPPLPVGPMRPLPMPTPVSGGG
jgi:hypothetical protein